MLKCSQNSAGGLGLIVATWIISSGTLLIHPSAAMSATQYERKHNTVAHRCLDLENSAERIDDTKFKLLDDLIDAVVAKIPPQTRSAAPTDPLAAKIALQSIDDILVDHNFVFPPVGLVDTFGDSLAPHQVDPEQLAMIKNHPSNQRRLLKINTNPNDVFYFTDGKTAAIFYLAVAEVLHIRLAMVEVPGGNFVRWTSGTSYFNWDTNEAIEAPDEMYISLARVPRKLVEEKIYLANLSDDDLNGYWHGLVGDRFYKARNYKAALSEHREAVRLYKSSAEQKNNLAWFLATCPDPQYRNAQEGIALAKEAVTVWSEPNWLDTLAAAYAEASDWDDAVATETKAKKLAAERLRSAFQVDPEPDYQTYIEAYRNHLSYAQVQSQSQNALHFKQSDVSSGPVRSEPSLGPCATDPTYQYFEGIQKKEYLKNPSARKLLLDSKTAEQELDETKEELNKRHNSLGGEPTLAGGDADSLLKQWLNVKLPTCYENRLIYGMLMQYVSEIEHARSALGLPLDAPPKYGSLPTPDINATTYPATSGTDSIVAFNVQLFMFDYQMAKVVLPLIEIKNDPSKKNVAAVNFSREYAQRALGNEPDIKINFAMALLQFLLLSPPETQPVDQAYDSMVMNLTTGMELFAVGHEYGHVIRKHKSSQTTLRLEEGEDNIAVDDYAVPVLVRSWNQEFEADDLGLKLVIQALRTRALSDPSESLKWLSSLYGIEFYFKCMDVTDKAKYIKQSGQLPRAMTADEVSYLRRVGDGTETAQDGARFGQLLKGDHPPAWLRLERMHRQIDKYVKEQAIPDDVLAFSQISIGIVADVDTIWEATSSRLPAIIEAVQSGAEGVK